MELDVLHRLEQRLSKANFQDCTVLDFEESKDFDWKEVAVLNASNLKNEDEMYGAAVSQIESFLKTEKKRNNKVYKREDLVFVTDSDDGIKVLWKIRIVESKMMVEKDIGEFKDSGMLAFANLILHTFGWCIAVEKNEAGSRMYPARTKFRGIGVEHSRLMYQKISKFMAENGDVLLEESELE